MNVSKLQFYLIRSHKLVLDSLHNCFPFIGSDSIDQVNYIKNLLVFSEYHPSAHSYVLNIIMGSYVLLPLYILELGNQHIVILLQIGEIRQ